MYFQIWISNNYAGGGHVVNDVIDKEVDKEMTKVVEEVNKKLVKEVNEGLVVVRRRKSLKVHMLTTYWRKAFCMWTMC